MRTKVLENVRRIVIKIGSRVLTDDEGGLDRDFLESLAREVGEQCRSGREVIIVSSGAIAAGISELGLHERPKTIPQKQATAAVGQSRLMQEYEHAFSRYDIKVAQVLLTGDDLANRLRFLNARATLDALLAFGVVPVINENDTVAVEEIKFGDNDNLSALVTTLMEADLLVILTDIDGYYDADPRTNPDARLVPEVRAVTRTVERAAAGSGSKVGTGGMITKLAAAKRVGRFGAPTIIVNGRKPGTLAMAINGQEVGTLFLPCAECLNRRKHWIAYTLRARGRLIIDTGALVALSRNGKSLLPSGVTKVEGDFDRGACVRICGPDGAEFAKGLVDYSSREISGILGHKTDEIEGVLGYRYGDEIIHRDNLVIL
ncbi:MAG: glutamate 5-kinase [Geobacteraceae bacterium]|nr:glutamate 5-kinase [Geobacteraceae bacterium]